MTDSIVTSDVRTRWGAPCLRDSGVTVASVVSMRRAGVDLSTILGSFPSLAAADVEGAIAWHERHGDEALGPRPPSPDGRYARITVDRLVQGGEPVITGTRVTVDAICGLHAGGRRVEDIIGDFPNLVAMDVIEALAYDAEADQP